MTIKKYEHDLMACLCAQLIHEHLEGLSCNVCREVDGRRDRCAIVLIYELNDDARRRLYRFWFWFWNAVIDLLSFWWREEGCHHATVQDLEKLSSRRVECRPD